MRCGLLDAILRRGRAKAELREAAKRAAELLEAVSRTLYAQRHRPAAERLAIDEGHDRVAQAIRHGGEQAEHRQGGDRRSTAPARRRSGTRLRRAAARPAATCARRAPQDRARWSDGGPPSAWANSAGLPNAPTGPITLRWSGGCGSQPRCRGRRVRSRRTRRSRPRAPARGRSPKPSGTLKKRSARRSRASARPAIRSTGRASGASTPPGSAGCACRSGSTWFPAGRGATAGPRPAGARPC